MYNFCKIRSSKREVIYFTDMQNWNTITWVPNRKRDKRMFDEMTYHVVRFIRINEQLLQQSF
jgi:hypothetical protein